MASLNFLRPFNTPEVQEFLDISQEFPRNLHEIFRRFLRRFLKFCRRSVGVLGHFPFSKVCGCLWVISGISRGSLRDFFGICSGSVQKVSKSSSKDVNIIIIIIQRKLTMEFIENMIRKTRLELKLCFKYIRIKERIMMSNKTEQFLTIDPLSSSTTRPSSCQTQLVAS